MKKKDIEKLFPNITEEQVKELERIENEAFEKGKKEADEAYKKAETERLLAEAITKSGAKNEKAVKSLLELDKISLEDGVLKGALEQIAELRKNCDYLFETETKKPQFTAKSKASSEITKKGFESMSYKKRLKLFLENPTLYKELQSK
ncbi:MAG: phage scaffolding protein [Clostridia bacterium]|nr:phage scaffolding protein [Clostridia bacterium]